jgi:predicted DsbA family dithiol-disulfide isomerase
MKQRIIVVLVLLSFVLIAQSNKKTVETEKVKIEIWSDIVCPYCFLGKKKMENAIAKLHAEDKVEIIWHSFQLDPDFPMDTSISTSEYLIERRGVPRKQVSQMTAQLVKQGRGYGIDFQFDKAHSFNTFDAHRLIQWAKKEDKSHELKEAFMINYFTHGLDLSVTENLMTIIEEVGLDAVKAKQILESNTYSEEVKHDINRSRQLGIRGVPFFLINGKASISGAQSDSVFEKELAAAL